ncbi:MAG: GAF domain-containing protein [Flavobacteriia bacterium]|nr:GAF domain-containing protein [Flavobacteriia bacterium]
MQNETYKQLENPFLVNLKNCEDEPIHLLGRLQSHGVMVAFDIESEKLKYFSETAIPQLERFEDLSNLDMSRIFDGETLKMLREYIKSGAQSWSPPKPVTCLGRQLSLHLNKNQSDIVLEMESYDAVDKSDLLEKISGLEGFLSSNKEYTAKLDLLTDAVIHFRKFTGFDRVMCYKFDENGDGEVVAEDRKRGLESFLGLRYPASDIPPQARKLYMSNLVRSIRDIGDDGVPIYGVGTEDMIDLSHSVYRSVSPIHLQYLRNMGVTATHANSLIMDGKLWGMLICHHYSEPKHLTFAERSLTVFYCSGISRYAQNLKNREFEERQAVRKELIHSLEANTDESLFDGFLKVECMLNSTLQISGFSVLESKEWKSNGIAPDIDEILKFEYRIRTSDERILFFDEVEEFSGPNSPAGCAVLRLSSNPMVVVLLYREEKKRIFTWAGNPSKAIEKGKEGELSPRKSFAQWKEKVEGRSLPWTEEEREFLSELRTSSVASLQYLSKSNVNLSTVENLQHRMKGINKTLEKVRLEKAQLAKELHIVQSAQTEVKELEDVKHLILSNLSHEMRTPLNGIMGLAEIMQLDEIDEPTRKEYSSLILKSGWRMLDTFNRLTHLDNLHSIPKRTNVTLSDFVNEVLGTYAVLAAKSNSTVTWKVHNQGNRVIRHPTLMHQSLTNLVANALRHGGLGINVNVDVRQTAINGADSLQIDVEDDGRGIQESIIGQVFEPFFTRSEVTKGNDQSAGLGLYIVKTYLESVGGAIEVESQEGEGTRFRVIIPINSDNE